ncbi:hypothetical protein QBZ16_002404 [Prototheca wickerhamii]|uniref:ABC1 atypical kinase-like domain-containing protein n=1 Tax=Prototheca wickerhamii TaxID=3111 RepID=A0AAD9MID6_PROWI|nr:hypothetical protein QBZ16_002404 [Prototheca wickerhamii]
MRRSIGTLARTAQLSLKSGSTTAAAEHGVGRDLERIPDLVRDIWGRHSESVLARLRDHGLCVRQLVQRWEAAELRLIAVANSLASHSGQRVVGVGFPLLASHAVGGSLLAHAYSSRRGNSYVVPLSTSKAPLNKNAGISADLGFVQRMLRAAVRALLVEIALAARAAFLGALFLPAVLSCPLLYCGDAARAAWLRLLRGTLARAGPAFIKWAQWAATRPDLFPADACAELAELQTGAPEHDWASTREAVERSFGVPMETLFDSFERRPVASGSIAQVHRARLSAAGAALAVKGGAGFSGLVAEEERDGVERSIEGENGVHDADGAHRASTTGTDHLHAPSTSCASKNAFAGLPATVQRRARLSFAPGATVAVKVRHPAVTELIERDIALLRRAARALEALGFGGQLRESVMQFGGPLREQLDLRVEAQHLRRFARNFSGWRGVRFPLPAGPALAAPEALVESFEEGELISRYISQGDADEAATPVVAWVKRRLAGLGLACYLKMLLRDNFVHADMHPGNILVALEEPAAAAGADRLSQLWAGARSRVLGWAGVDARVPRLVLLDVGMTAALSDRDRARLVDFFRELTRMDGRAVADAIMGFAAEPPPAARAEGLRRDLGGLFAGLDPDALRANTSAVVADLMDAIRRHGVQLEGVVTTVIITTCVLEGWSTKLDPGIRIMESLRDILPQAWHERAGRALDASFDHALTPLSSLAVACA